MDGDELISGGQLAVQVIATGEPDYDDQLLMLLDEKKAAASVRWAVTIGDDGGTQLSLHGLPLGKEAVSSKPSLRGDNAPVIDLFSVPLLARVFDGERVAGPVPFIIVSSQEAADFVNDNPAVVQNELQKLAACFFRPELMSRQDALAMLKKPREGKGAASFLRRKTAAGGANAAAAKRQKSAPAPPESGTAIFISASYPAQCFLHSNTKISALRLY